MSKFIKNSRLRNLTPLWSDHLPDGYWQSNPFSAKEIEEQKKYKEEMNFKEKEKQRIESIPLEELSFKDLYKFPFHQAKFGSWVYDANSNFIFQFQMDNQSTQEKCIEILNGNLTPTKGNKFVHKEGMIYLSKDEKLHEFILIRNWGGLTGTGGYNLDAEYACKIQDTLADYIIEKLNK
jgi:hypothetical protein